MPLVTDNVNGGINYEPDALIFWPTEGNLVEKLKCFLSSSFIVTGKILLTYYSLPTSPTTSSNVYKNDMWTNFINTQNSNRHYQNLADNRRSLQQEIINNRRWGSC